MDDIKLLIKISNKTYESIQSGDYCGIINTEIYNAIKNGVPQVTETITEFADRCRECGKQKTGHWIYLKNERKSVVQAYKCSVCGWEIDSCRGLMQDTGHRLFCEHCGAKMIDSQERSDKE